MGSSKVILISPLTVDIFRRDMLSVTSSYIIWALLDKGKHHLSKDRHRVAVVTGGASGIGLSIVRRFLEDGYRVAFFSSTPRRVRNAASELSNQFDVESIMASTIDITDRQSVEDFWSTLNEKWDGASVLVNNAGISPKRGGKRIPFHEIPPEEWQRVLSVNLTGAFLCTQLALQNMTRRQYGRIVMIGSLAGRAVPQLAGASYVASKGGVSSLVKSIVAEYSDLGITANTVCPGSVATEMMGDPDSDAYKCATARIPAGRMGTGFDIAGMVHFLCSEEATFITGTSIDVNGGEYTAA